MGYDILQPQQRYLRDLRQCSFNLPGARIFQPRLKTFYNRIAFVQPCADNEGKAELFAICKIVSLERGYFVRTEPVQSGASLLAIRFWRQRSRERRLTHQI